MGEGDRVNGESWFGTFESLKNICNVFECGSLHSQICLVHLHKRHIFSIIYLILIETFGLRNCWYMWLAVCICPKQSKVGSDVPMFLRSSMKEVQHFWGGNL
jgi:hypothetical protein